MAELERRLEELGRQWDPPPTPHVVDAVVARLADRPAPGAPRIRRRLVVSLAFALLLIGAVAAIAPAREAILDLFRTDSETVRPVPTLPPARTTVDQSDLGERLSLDEARRRSTFAIRGPQIAELGPPDEVYRREPPPGGLVTFVWRARPGFPRADQTGAGLLMTQVTGHQVVEKGLDPSTRTSSETVGGEEAIWIEGGPHVISYLDERDEFRQETTRLAGNVLVWSQGLITYRLEGRLTKGRALEIAESVR